jgi:hypothetical protein
MALKLPSSWGQLLYDRRTIVLNRSEPSIDTLLELLISWGQLLYDRRTIVPTRTSSSVPP